MRAEGDALRALFLNEGELGRGVMGHPAVEEALRCGLEGRAVEARFRSLPALAGLTRAATRSFPLLGQADLDLQTVRWHVVQSLRARRLLRRELRERGADVLHVHSHAIALTLGGDMRRVRTFLSVDATVWDWRELGVWRSVRSHSRLAVRPSLALERRIFASAARVLAWSDWARRGVERACPQARIVEHHPGLDLGRFRPGGERAGAPVRVLFVGGRFVEKGGLDLLAALEPHLGERVELHLVTPADVDAGSRSSVYVHRLSRHDPRLVELYREADVFCLPTYADASPWALLEAMACGTPAVGTAVGAIPQILDHGGAGHVVAPGDVPGLRAALEALIGDPARRRELGARARARCEERYDAVRQTAELVGLMRRSLEEPLAPR